MTDPVSKTRMCPACGRPMGASSKLCRRCYMARAANRRATIAAFQSTEFPPKPLPKGTRGPLNQQGGPSHDRAGDELCVDVRGCYFRVMMLLPTCKKSCNIAGVDLQPDHPDNRRTIAMFAAAGRPIVTLRGELR